jgi:two-component sensor histidine kinase
MALLHEKLYRSRDLAHIDLGQYLEELAASLLHTYGGAHRGIGLRVNARNALFDIDTAIVCGLIVNELISNSLEHAFPGGATGTIAVELAPGPASTYTLTVADNGIGFPEGLDVLNSPSLGLQLVATLADQLGGSLAWRGQGGVAVSITFPVPAGGETTRP